MREELDTVDVEFDEETHVGRLTLNRPDALNTLSPQLTTDVCDGLDLLEEQNEDVEGIALRAVVIEGAGDRAFCAGADVTSFGGGDDGATHQNHYKYIREFDAPVIAKIHGYCLGGGLETAMSCDFRFATEDAELGLPEVDLGINPGAGGVQFIAEAANVSVAKEMAMLGQDGSVSGAEAAELGIVNDAHDPDDLDEAVSDFAEQIASKPPLSVQTIKRSGSVALESTLEEGIEYDEQQLPELLGSEDAQKGMRAFSDDDYEPEYEGL